MPGACGELRGQITAMTRLRRRRGTSPLAVWAAPDRYLHLSMSCAAGLRGRSAAA
jgi:hypothetical protein